MNANLRVFVLVGAMLAVTACGSSASPAVSPAPSSVVQASPAAPAPSPATAVNEGCNATPRPFDANTVNLTGSWAGDDDGIYYLRQMGSTVWWNGMAGNGGSPSDLGREWNNVARGEIKGLEVDVEWADTPRGQIQDGGTMSLKIEDDGTGNVRIVKVTETSGDFGNNVWTPCKIS